ncbi:MAG: M20/M25/M40 family metallo-hydrolase [Bacteroidota bacterium]
MKNIILNLLVLFVIQGMVSFNYSQIADGYQDGLKSIDKSDIQKSVTYLASDDMKGRAVGTDENLTAARFVAKRFYEFGLTSYDDLTNPIKLRNHKKKEIIKSGESLPLDFYDDFFQRFYLKESKLNQAASWLSVFKKNDTSGKAYHYNCTQDFIIDYGSNKSISINGPLVFLGYGIDKQENGYDDYLTDAGKMIDVKNKIVIMIDGYPQQDDSSSYFNESKNKGIKSIKQKANTAYEKGALAVFVAQSPIKKQPQFGIKVESLSNAFSRSDFSLPEVGLKESIPIIYISSEVLTDIFSGSGYNCSDIVNSIENNLESNSFEIKNVSINIEAAFDSKIINTQNVIGFKEGTDPVLKNEYVVIGAHYDHVGVGNFGAMNSKDKGKIHNGADDNASGTAGLIELAEAFSKVETKRSIIFIGFSAEETGIHGSKHYAYQNPLKPIENTVGMVNLDMIGRNDTNIVWVGGIFYSSDMKTLVEEANTKIGFELLYNVGLLTFGSDQGPFIKKEIPSVFFFSGLHDDYHTPNDDADKIDFNKTEKVSKLAYLSAWMLANNSTVPNYRALSNDEKVILVQDSIARQKKFIKEN